MRGHGPEFPRERWGWGLQVVERQGQEFRGTRGMCVQEPKVSRETGTGGGQGRRASSLSQNVEQRYKD